MEPPIAPKPEAFGLTEAKVDRLSKAVWFQSETHDGHRMMVFMGAFILVADVWFARANEVKTVFGFFCVGVISLMLGILPAAIAWFTLSSLEKKIRAALSPAFRNLLKFRDAQNAYQSDKADYEKWYWRRQEAFWRALSGIQFENQLGRLFMAMGYDVSATPRTGDGGVDLLLRRAGKLTVVQCKAHNKKIPINVARELSAAMRDFQAHDAIIACLEGATKPVHDYIKDKPIRVMDLRDILDFQRQLR